MKKRMSKLLSLVLALMLVLTFAATPVSALDSGRREFAQIPEQSSEPEQEELQTEQSVSEPEPEPKSEATGEPEVIEGGELLMTIPIGQQTLDGEPATGGSSLALAVSVVYPKGKELLQKGDEITLVFSLQNYNDFTGTQAMGDYLMEKGIGAYELTLTYAGAFDVTGVTSSFTSSTTPKLANLSYNENKGGDVDTLSIVALFSEKVNKTVQALNAAALKNKNGQFLTVKLKLTQDITGDVTSGTLPINISGTLAIVEGNKITEEPFAGEGGLTQNIGYDTAAPVIIAKDLDGTEKDLLKTPIPTVESGAIVEISDESSITYTVKKGTASYTTRDEDESGNKVVFRLTDVGIYTITATDAAGNTVTGKVTVTPRVTGIALAVKGTTLVGETHKAYIGTSFTVTPTLSPAINTLPNSDKEIEWVIYCSDGVGDFITASGTGLSAPVISTEDKTITWTQLTAAPVTFTVNSFKAEYGLTVRSVEKKPSSTEPRAESETLPIQSPAKINSVTIKSSASSILSSGTPQTAEVTGVITTQSEIPFDGDNPTPNDFIAIGSPLTVISSNTNLVHVKNISISPATAGKGGYSYAYTATVEAENNASGICDITVTCGDVAAQTSINVVNYGNDYTKMLLTASSVGLDPVQNTSATLNITLANPKNAADSIVVNADDCVFSSSNSSLLYVSSSDGKGTVYVNYRGSSYVTAETKVTITATLSDDPLGRKASLTFTVYPTERTEGLSVQPILNDSISDAVTDGTNLKALYVTDIPAEMQLFVMYSSQQSDSEGGIGPITPANKKLVKFTSSNTKVATVSDTGLISVKGYGESIISVAATDGSGKSVQFKVLAHKQIQTLMFPMATNGGLIEVAPGGKVSLKPSATIPVDATNAKMTGISWEVEADYSDGLLTLDKKTGTVTASKTIPELPDYEDISLTVRVTVPDMQYESGSLIQKNREYYCTVVLAKPDADQLKAFTALDTKTVEVAKGQGFTVKVVNEDFTANAQWILKYEDGSEYNSPAGPSFSYSYSSDNPLPTGKATLYATYGGKTLTATVTVYDPVLPKTAKINLVTDESADEYYLFDCFTSSKFKVVGVNGTTQTDISAEDVIFTSSMPGLVSVDNEGNVVVNDQVVAQTLTKDTKVTITAALRNDPYGRKVTKVITVTNKILPDDTPTIHFYNNEAYSSLDNKFDMSKITDYTFSPVLTSPTRDGTSAFCVEKKAYVGAIPDGAYVFSPADEGYAQAFAAYTFTSSNTKVATVDKYGVVTLKGAGTATIRAEQAKGTYDPKTETPYYAERTIVVEESTTSLTLNQSVYTVVAGAAKPTTFTLKATLLPKTAKVDNWESSNEEVATVDQTGKVTINAGLKAGDEATITATSGGCLAECKIKVTAAGITVTGANKLTADQKKLKIGNEYYLYFRSNTEKVSDIIVASSNSNVAEVSKDIERAEEYDTAKELGYRVAIYPQATGSATISVSASGKTYSETFSVYQYDPAGTALNLIPAGGLLLDESNTSGTTFDYLTVQLINKNKAVLEEEIDPDNVSFVSSNPALLVVNQAGGYYVRNLNSITKVTSVTVTATIKNETGARTGKITFKVSPVSRAVKQVTIIERDTKEKFIKYGEPYDSDTKAKLIYTDIGDPQAQKVFNLGATLNRTNGTKIALADSKMVTWKSSDTKVATVDANGTVTAKAKGTAIITATAKDGSELSDSVILRVNHSAVLSQLSSAVPGGELATIEMVGGSTYTIPWKVNPSNGDLSIYSYEVVDGSEYLTVDAKGTLKAAKVTDTQTAMVAIQLKQSRYNLSGDKETYYDGPTSGKLTFDVKIAPADKAVKSLGLYDAANKAVSKIDASKLEEIPLYIKGTDATNKALTDFSNLITSYEVLNSYADSSAKLICEVEDNKLTVFAEAPGTYKLYVSLGGKTVSCTINALYTYWDGNDNDLPLTAKVKLTGKIEVKDKSYNLAKIDTNTYNVKIAILTDKGTSIGSDKFIYTSNNPLVTVDGLGYITLAKYIPKETKVTVTATLKNDPTKHVVQIPITVSGQRLVRRIEINDGKDQIPEGETRTYAADKTNLRLRAYCWDIIGQYPDNTAVTWKSSNTKVATVDKNGVVKRLSKGETVITATAADGGGAVASFTLKLT